MDLVSITQEQKKVSLLSLPRFDLGVSDEAATSTVAQNQENEAPDNNSASRSELILMQLPSGLKLSDLTSGSCYFVAPREDPASAEEVAEVATYNATARQACMVVESKKQSFAVSRLETSNALVLVPPVDPPTTQEVPTVTVNGADGPALKKTKLANSLLPVPARLLKPGGSGASFLELRPKMLRPGDLMKILQKHVFDPYNNNNNNNNNNNTTNARTGRSLPSLANQLQCSKGQVEDALKLLRSFPIPGSADDTVYGVLSEEALQEAQSAMVSTLSESDDFGDYANKGVAVDKFIKEAMDRLDQKYAQQEHVLRYAMTTLLKTAQEQDEDTLPLLVDADTEHVQLDVKKIAAWLAHRLFQAQTRPWDEKRFIVRWQSELPGVGKDYQISLDMLRGVAIPVESSGLTPRKQTNDDDDCDKDEERFWKYLPADKLPLSAGERFRALFALREQWSSEDLEPYMDGLVKDTGLSPAEILLQHTTHMPSPKKGMDGKSVKLYNLKR